ncbi:hypothetical protein BHE18_21225 [Rossellomorea aquimaris]|uniref:Uncharacterized protein n=1 Tax=Rossellomorea aquimaris TaxID=189382 RepID=A0A1J6WXU1_9BACI|nr:hypothetical protein BHE18_21225 [Rossellomorea aquimaris]
MIFAHSSFWLECKTKTPAGEAANVRLVQLQGLEAHVISQLIQEGKERLRGRFALCHPPLTKAPPLFYPEAKLRRLTGHPRKASLVWKPKAAIQPFSKNGHKKRGCDGNGENVILKGKLYY